MPEATAQAFVRSQVESGTRIGSLSTLLSEANRSAGRKATKRTGSKARTRTRSELPRACKDCGLMLNDPSRKYCDTCFPERREVAIAVFATAGPASLTKHRAESTDPAHTETSRRKQAVTASFREKPAILTGRCLRLQRKPKYRLAF